ncbi:MAG TPA: hypothetical protein VEP50_14235 [bacterium]|nr:hypothetical protein [bacterium]
MHRIAAIVLGMLLITLGVSSVALAQNVVYVQGKIQAIDCQANTLVLRGANGSINTLLANTYTAVFINSAPVGFCALRQYIGSYATASVTAAGNQLVTGRVDVVLTIAPPPPYYYAYPYSYYYPYGYYGPPFYPGIGIGIVVVGPHFRHFHGGRFVGVPAFRGRPGPVPAGPGFRGPVFRAPPRRH